jgi:hypothetical protein
VGTGTAAGGHRYSSWWTQIRAACRHRYSR